MKQKQLEHNEIIQNRTAKNKKLPVCILTDGINDTGNLGMIFRLADALNIEKILIYNLKKDINAKVLKKKSRSTSEHVKFEIITDIREIINLTKTYNFVTLEKTNKSIDIKNFNPVFPVCLVIGSEKHGISEKILEISGISVHLPMFGNNTSVNAATATAVILYDLYYKFNKNSL